MTTPDFYASAPRITVTDPLAAFLGAAGDGVIEYSYLDVVKLAGHSCPTVACSFLLARKALQALYPNELPHRGGIRVEMRDGEEDGVTGVIAAVVGMITGAAAEGGFRGIAGRFGRRNLLSFDAPIKNEVRFTRLDTGASVEVNAHPEVAMPSPTLRQALGRALEPQASVEARRDFGVEWQGRVRELLTVHADRPETIDVVH